MKKVIFDKFIEILEDLKQQKDKLERDYSRIAKDLEILALSSSENAKSLSNLEASLNEALSELEKQKVVLQQLNSYFSMLDSKIKASERSNELDKIKKTLSTLIYDFNFLRDDIRKQVGILENKVALVESKIKIQTNSDSSSLRDSLNEIKDAIKLSMQGLNAKMNSIFENVTVLEKRIALNELILTIASSSDKSTIERCLNEIGRIGAEIKAARMNKEILSFASNFLENMYAYYKSIEQADMASMFMQKKLELENM